MKAIADKIRFIYLPFLLISAGFVVAYSFLNWALVIRGGLSIHEEITNLWLPFVLPWIPVLVWLRPRLRALKFKKSGSLFWFEFVTVLAIAISTIIAQSYLETATGKLTKIDRVSQIQSSPSTKYYLIKEFFADKGQATAETSIRRGARSGDPLSISAFFASPLRDSVDEPTYAQRDVWLGVKYTATMKSRDQTAIEDEYQKFAQTSAARFGDEDLKSFSHLARVGNNDDRRSFEAAIHKSAFYHPSKQMIILTGEHEAFELRNGQKLAWACGMFGIGSAVWFVLLLFPKIDEVELMRIQRGHPSRDKNSKDALNSFLPRAGFYVTPIIMGLNILVFLVMIFAGLGVASFQASDLLNWGANYSSLVREGQWFRLVTSMFVHGGLMHLLANLYGLYFAGVLLEPMLGKMKFAVAYFATGIAGSTASILFHPKSVSLGASGAIFGLFGVLLVLLLVKDFGRARLKDPLLINIAIFVGLNLLVGSVAIGIDNAAHLGGLVTGILLGAFFFPTLHAKAGGIRASE